MKELICIVCPRGCHLSVDEKTFEVTGNGCPRGAEYGSNELRAPSRTLTTTVAVGGGALRRLPVRTDKPIPKGELFTAMKLLAAVRVDAPVLAGQTVYKNICGSGADAIACCDCERK